MARYSLRLAHRKRLINVSSTPEDAEPVSLENHFKELDSLKKVRQQPYIRSLKKVNKHFVPGKDHIYSLPEGPQNEISSEFNSDSETRIGMAFDHYQTTRGMKCSEKNEISFSSVRRQKCSSRNAVNARLNREKKKQYITSLERSNKDLKSKNDEIVQKIDRQKKVITELQNEVLYLKSLLANSKEISTIFTCLKASTGLPVSSSLKALSTDQSSKIGNSADPEKNNKVLAKNQVDACRIKTVTSGANFPILQDVNLCSYLDLKNSDENEALADWEHKNGNNNDLYGDLLESNSYLGSSDIDIPFDSLYDDGDILFKNENFSTNVFNNDILTPNVGLCLHVSNKQISVELCSLCNSKSQVL